MIRFPHVTGVEINHVAQGPHKRLRGTVDGLQVFMGCFCEVGEERLDALVLLVESAAGILCRATSASTYHGQEKIFLCVMPSPHISLERLHDLPDLAAVQRSVPLEFLDDVGEG